MDAKHVQKKKTKKKKMKKRPNEAEDCRLQVWATLRRVSQDSLIFSTLIKYQDLRIIPHALISLISEYAGKVVLSFSILIYAAVCKNNSFTNQFGTRLGSKWCSDCCIPFLRTRYTRLTRSRSPLAPSSVID